MSANELPKEFKRFVEHPGVRMPDRRRRIHSHGVGLAVSEWGEASARPILLAHGGFDFAATFSVFAPLLAQRGYRVVSFDQRGHGDSDHSALYSWSADLRDALSVLDSISQDPIPLIGHSKGGALLTQFSQAYPHRVSHLVNIDGMPSRRRSPDVADHERSRLLDREISDWLDHRRRLANRQRRAGPLEELARRRGKMNPRLTHDWLCFLVTQGARLDSNGWRWKLDPSMRFGGFGPWNPTWELEKLPGLTPPLLAMLATEAEELGWGTREKDLPPYLPRHAKVISFEQTGHFIHIERPHAVVEHILEFLE
ncbi:MAG: alpha/beta hydrolase [Myxococcota bacterium]|nr:alpha/beta hydrolase [Myxococcota bacterium]